MTFYLKCIVLTVIMTFSIKTLLIDVYYVAGSSMAEVLLNGDRIIVSKRILNETLNFKSEKIKKSDIIVFKNPLNNNEKLVKRCLGIPNDTLKIKNNKILINENMLTKPKSETTYQIEAIGRLTIEMFKDMRISELRYKDNNIYHIKSVDNIDKEIISLSFIKKVKRLDEINDIETYLQKSKNIKALIPQKGETYRINSSNIDIYYSIIKKFENKEILQNDSTLSIAGKIIENYTFQQNYYFFVGDNQENSFDSRNFGPIPDNFVIGKALMLFFSTNHPHPYKLINLNRFCIQL